MAEAGSYELRGFNIRSLDGGKETDIRLMVHGWTLNESINSDCVYGSATVYDGVGLFYDFPLRGEELIEISYVDYFGVEKTEMMFLTGVTDLAPAKDGSSDLLRYQIHFVSVGKFVSEACMVRRGFRGEISDMVLEVFEGVYRGGIGDIATKKALLAEKTEGEVSLVVPNYSAAETMNFFARNAYGGVDLTSTYRFFERRDGYVFSTLDYLFDAENFASTGRQSEKQTFEWGVFLDETPEGQYRKMQNIMDLRIPKPIDTMSDMTEGAFYKRAIEVDYMVKGVTQSDYKTLDNIPAYNAFLGVGGGVKPRHTEEFVRKFLTDGKSYLMLKDYSTRANNVLRNDPLNPQKTMASHAVEHLNSANRVIIKVFGRNSIMAGETVDVLLDKFKANPTEQDYTLSGTYLVENAASEFIEDTYMQVLTLIRGGIGNDFG